MTLYTFPYAPFDVRAALAANAALWPAGTTYDGKHPTTWRAAPHIQYAWDGTPTQTAVSESATIRVTVWGWKTATSSTTNEIHGEDDCADLASLVQAVLHDSQSSNIWRYDRGLGRSTGTDPDTGLPFCTFTVTAETKPHAATP